MSARSRRRTTLILFIVVSWSHRHRELMYRRYHEQPEADHPSTYAGHQQQDLNQQNLQNLHNSTMQPMSSVISLPPISSIDFHAQTVTAAPGHMTHPLPPPPRTLPPLPYHYSMQTIPHMPEYVTASRPLYPGMQSYHPMHGGRMPLPSTNDPNISVVPSRQIQKTREVKRRTKTGCMTCRKRRIKVST